MPRVMTVRPYLELNYPECTLVVLSYPEEVCSRGLVLQPFTLRFGATLFYGFGRGLTEA